MGETALYHKLSDDCHRVLDEFRFWNWRVSALQFIKSGLFSHRQRISDLRVRHLLTIKADSHRDPETGRLHTTYYIPEHCIPRAKHLLMHWTLEGFVEAPVQGGLYR